MRVRRLKITNFRGISLGSVDFAGHTLLVGGNNIGKSTVCALERCHLGRPGRAACCRVMHHPFSDDSSNSARRRCRR
jgi:recombinational DNA repair ATPase RecF